MALLELLAGAAPAGIVAADLLVLLEAAGLDDRQRADRLLVVGIDHARGGVRAGRGCDRVAALGRATARVAERAGRGGVLACAPLRPGLLLLLLGLDGHLDVEDVARELV